MYIIDITTVMLLSVMSASGCSFIQTIPIEDNIKPSHLVIIGRITDGNETFFKANIECVIKNRYNITESSILITQIATGNDGLCFENDFKVHEKYILFLRRIGPNVFRPYSEELHPKKLLDIAEACDKIKQCEKDCFLSNMNTTTQESPVTIINSAKKQEKTSFYLFSLLILNAVFILH